MKQKIFLTSFIAMGVMAPAMAEPSHTDSFPNDGYMQEDYTYTNAATSDNMDGVYSGTVNAVAEYDIIDYIVNAGQYLPADSETVITCPAGSYCPGISGNVQYNQTTPQGIQTCPTGYASSAAGASSDTQCYRQCSGNVTIEHATAVTGNDYYGNGVDTCEPTGCVNGWHLKPGLNLSDAIGDAVRLNSAYISPTGQFGESSFEGVSDPNNQHNPGTKGQAYYGITDNNTWAVEYASGKGMVIGQGICSTQPGSSGYYTNGIYDGNGDWSNITMFDSLTDERGQTGAYYCYCNITGYKGPDGTMQSLTSAWMFLDSKKHEFNTPSEAVTSCSDSCSWSCASDLGKTYSNNLAERSLLFSTVDSTLASCDANTITINWNDVDPATAGQNNEGTAVYGEDVRTPVKAATKKGQTFRGWRFSKPTETNLP